MVAFDYFTFRKWFSCGVDQSEIRNRLYQIDLMARHSRLHSIHIKFFPEAYQGAVNDLRWQFRIRQ
jgi:hypothetical protein